MKMSDFSRERLITRRKELEPVFEKLINSRDKGELLEAIEKLEDRQVDPVLIVDLAGSMESRKLASPEMYKKLFEKASAENLDTEIALLLIVLSESIDNDSMRFLMEKIPEKNYNSDYLSTYLDVAENRGFEHARKFRKEDRVGDGSAFCRPKPGFFGKLMEMFKNRQNC